MMAKIKVVAAQKGDILDKGRVVWGDRGQPFMFDVSPYGTAIANQAVTETGKIDAAGLVALINQIEAVVIQNNPKYDDVKTDTDGDGASDSDGTRYGWATEGLRYTATVA